MASRKTIERTITTTIIRSCTVSFKDGVPEHKENEPLIINGLIEDVKAIKEIRKLYGENTQLIDSVKVEELYEISVEDFIKYASKVKAKV